MIIQGEGDISRRLSQYTLKHAPTWPSMAAKTGKVGYTRFCGRAELNKRCVFSLSRIVYTRGHVEIRCGRNSLE